MADNFEPGTTAAPVATDEIGGVHYQRFKVGYGTDGSYADVAPATGLPVAGAVTTFSATEDAEGDTVLFTADVPQYRSVAIYMSEFPDATAETGWVQFEQSPDGIAWVAAPIVENADNGWQLQAGYASPLTAVGPVEFRYYRATLHNGTGGVLPTPVTVIAQFTAEPTSLMGARSTLVRVSPTEALEVLAVDSEGASIAEDNPLPVGVSVNGQAATEDNPLPVALSFDGETTGADHPLPVTLFVNGTDPVSVIDPLPITATDTLAVSINGLGEGGNPLYVAIDQPVVVYETTADEITGGVADGESVQRVKVGYGTDGSYADAAPDAGLPVGSSYLELSGTIAANGATAFAAQDVSAYRWASVWISGTWTGTLRLSISMDGTNWYDGYAGRVDSPFGSTVNSVTNGLWGMPLSARYFRVISSAWTSGTASVVVGFSALPSAPMWPQTITGASSNTLADDTSGFMEFKVGALGMVYDGTNWDRIRNVTAVDGLGSAGLLAAGAIAYDSAGAVNRRVLCDATGRLLTAAAPAISSTVTSVTASVTSVTLLAANAVRTRAIFYNDSSAELHLKLGATASTTSYTIKMAGGGYYETPDPPWRGVIDGVWSAANGAVRVTELV